MAKRTFINASGPALSEHNFYTLGGLNLYSPDEIMSDKESPYARNFRLFKDNSLSSRVCVSKRDGKGFYTVPSGEASAGTQTSTTGAADQTISGINWFAQKFTVSAAGRLTKVEINLKNDNSGTAPLLVDIYTDSSGPSVKVASSSIPQTDFGSTYAYEIARFIEAPAVATSTDYWIVIHQQTEGTGDYKVSSTTNATNAMTSANAGNTWAAASYDLNYKVYVSTNKPVKGFYRYYRSTTTPMTLLVVDGTLSKVTDATGALTTISSSLDTGATDYKFTTIQNICYIVNGVDNPKTYNGTTFADLGGSPGVSKDVCAHKDRLFLLNNDGKIQYSETADYDNFGATSFVYGFPPNSADQALRIIPFQDNIVAFSRNGKAMISGSDVSTMVRRESTATHGVVGPNAICKDGNYIYFVGKDDIYKFNGGSDEGLGIKVDRILDNCADTSDIYLIVHGDQIRIYYTPTGEGANSRCLIYDLGFKQWMADDEIYISHAQVFNSQTDQNVLVEGSSLVGALYYGETGTSDLGKPIKFDYYTKYHSFDHPTRKHRIKRLYPHFRPADTNYAVTVGVDADENDSPDETPVYLGTTGAKWGPVSSGGTGDTWGGGATWGKGTLTPERINVPGSARKHQIRFTQHGVDNPVEIIGYTAYTQAGKVI